MKSTVEKAEVLTNFLVLHKFTNAIQQGILSRSKLFLGKAKDFTEMATTPFNPQVTDLLLFGDPNRSQLLLLMKKF